MNESIPEKYRKDVVIIRETATQIIRDLNLSDSEIILGNNLDNAFEELKAQLIPIVRRMMKGDKSSFQSMLYRVDISERDYKNFLSESGAIDFEEGICEQIIRREFQKVITRKYFSEKGDSPH